MPVIFTFIARVRDWKALRELNHEALVTQASKVGAKGFQICRNVNDASEALILAEFPDHDAAREMGQMLGKHIQALLMDGLSDLRAWEPTGWEGIGGQNIHIAQQAEKGGLPANRKT